MDSILGSLRSGFDWVTDRSEEFENGRDRASGGFASNPIHGWNTEFASHKPNVHLEAVALGF